MAEVKKRTHRARIAARAGKNPGGQVEMALDSSKARAGGAVMKSKKGGIVRKPTAKVRYKRTHTNG